MSVKLKKKSAPLFHLTFFHAYSARVRLTARGALARCFCNKKHADNEAI
jgi:hypothetical protein